MFDKPDPAAAKVIQEVLGGRFGEMRTMMQFSFKVIIFVVMLCSIGI